MKRKSILEDIEKKTERLTPQEQLKLVEILIHKLKNLVAPEGKSLDWNQLYGLGKEIWKGDDAQLYVDRLREDRV